MIEWITNWVKSIITAFGYPGLVLVMFMENLFPPIPSEIILPLAGSLSINGDFTIPEVVFTGVVGSVAGAWVFDGLSRWLNHYGEFAVFLGRMVPVIRSLISIPAGMAHMDEIKFTLYTILGSACWNLVLSFAGRLLGQEWPLASEFMEDYQNVTLFVIAK